MNTTQKRRAHGGHRSNRNHGFFAPAFGNIINEILNSPLNEVVTDKPKKYTYPQANVISEDGTYILSLAIPGVAKDDVSINIEKNKLTIKSEVEENTDIKYRLREFNYAKFERAFTLSDDVDIDNISAKFDNGVLTISIPTVEEAGPKKVEIG
ncbi:MAG: HSP20 family protein [Halioglobus sp.]|jgi:HSP20 family protein